VKDGSYLNVSFLELRFEKDDIFIVQNDMEGDWMWVTSLRTNESGCVFRGKSNFLLENITSLMFCLGSFTV